MTIFIAMRQQMPLNIEFESKVILKNPRANSKLIWLNSGSWIPCYDVPACVDLGSSDLDILASPETGLVSVQRQFHNYSNSFLKTLSHDFKFIKIYGKSICENLNIICSRSMKIDLFILYGILCLFSVFLFFCAKIYLKSVHTIRMAFFFLCCTNSTKYISSFA